MKEKKREKEEREEREENERREKEVEERQQRRKQQQKEELRHQFEEEFLFEKAKDSGFRCFSEVCYQTMSYNFDINLSS